MAPPIPTREPRQFIAGDTVLWTKTLADYPPSDGWTLQYKLVGPSQPSAAPVVTVDGDTYSVTLAATATNFATFVPGAYRLIGWVTNVALESHTIYDAYTEIKPNPRVAAFATLRTHEERMLAAIQAALEGRTTADIEHYQLDGTAITKIPAERLMQLQGIYQAKVWRQQNEDIAYPTTEVAFVADADVDARDLDWQGGWP